jgi:hypothetical protein
MKSPRRNRSLVVALYVNASLLLALLAAVLAGGRIPSVLPEAYAAPAAPQPIAGGGGLYLMPAQFALNAWGCYVMDTDSQTLSAYVYFPGEKKLRLAASRLIRNDRKLQRFNSDNPTPDEVAGLLELEKAGRRDAPRNEKPQEEPAEPPAENR